MPQAFSARALSAIGAVVLVFVVSLHAYGAPILVGGAMVTPGEPDPTGGVLYAGPGAAINGIPQAFAAAGFSGTLTTTVIKDDPSNPFAGIGDPDPTHHGLTFVYQLHNDATSVTSLGRMTNIDFS